MRVSLARCESTCEVEGSSRSGSGSDRGYHGDVGTNSRSGSDSGSEGERESVQNLLARLEGVRRRER
jgi:hypothetical protein